MSDNASYIAAFVICFLNVLIFTLIYYKLSEWYDGLTKLLQLAQALLFVFAIILCFHFYSLKLNLTLTIIVVLLAGDVLEVWYGFIMNAYCKVMARFSKSKK
jgi:ABC-type proline/glycine betaine transport system permease subunit